VKINHTPLSIFIALNSVEDAREPPKPGIVRGEILHSYYYLEEVSGGVAPETRVVVEVAVDPKGSIPSWLVNLTQKHWPHSTLLALERVANRSGILVPDEIEKWFK
jgi:hypothetical protein